MPVEAGSPSAQQQVSSALPVAREPVTEYSPAPSVVASTSASASAAHSFSGQRAAQAHKGWQSGFVRNHSPLPASVLAGGSGPAMAERHDQGRLLAEAADQAGKRFKVVGQAHERYVVAETPAGIAVIDQHALHERQIYDQLSASAERQTGQKLLVPAVVELNPAEMAVFLAVKEELARLGFEAEAFGERSVAVQAAPAVLRSSRVGSVLRDCLADLASGNVPRGGWEEPLLKRLACQAAVKAGDHLPRGEIESLLQKHAANPARLTCPHGRPALIMLTKEELERRFGRI